ncbi:MAG: ferredoxin, partial [Candidatus Nealsonbacteria bacterium]
MPKIILKRDECIGCGSCQAVCPKFWKIADDGKTNLLNSKQPEGSENYELELADVECNQEAADACPVQCI